MTDSLNNPLVWQQHMRLAIQANIIANMVREWLNSGRGAPSVEDMRFFSKEAEVVADLWEQALTREK